MIPDLTILPDSRLRYDAGFFSPEEAARYFDRLQDETPWRQERIRLFGRDTPIPRLQSWHGDPDAVYAYSGLRMQPEPWSGVLEEIRNRLHEALPEVEFNSVLLNLYRDGRDSMGWHRDDEPELGPEPTIASVSLGAPRCFQLRHKSRGDLPRVDLDLEHGSVLWMEGETQRHWEHALPKRLGRNAPAARINLTFRRVFPR